jgi:hypothetical protein
MGALTVGWIVREPREEPGRAPGRQRDLETNRRGLALIPSLSSGPSDSSLAPLTIHYTTSSYSLAWNCLQRGFPGPIWALEVCSRPYEALEGLESWMDCQGAQGRAKRKAPVIVIVFVTVGAIGAMLAPNAPPGKPIMAPGNLNRTGEEAQNG